MADAKVAQKIGKTATDRLGRKLSNNRLMRRAKMMLSTLDLVAEHGYEAVTVDQLAAAGGVSKKTIYDIYGSKQGLVAQAVALRLDDLVERFNEELAGSGLDRLLRSVDLTCDAVLHTPALSRALAPMLVKSAEEFRLTSFFERLHRDAVVRMKNERQIHPWVDIDFTARSIMLDQVAVQNMWAGGNIDDASYPSFARLSVLRIMTPLAKASVRKDLVEEIRLLQDQLCFASLERDGVGRDGPEREGGGEAQSPNP